MRFLKSLFSTGFGVVLVVVLIAAIALIPLLTVYQSKCREGRTDRTRYSFVPPWDEKPRGCRQHKTGLKVLLEEVGLS